MEEERAKKIFDSATASQRKETTGNAKPNAGGEASLREAKAYTAADVHRWMAEVRARKNEQGKPAVRKAQLAMLEIVVDRVCAELEEGEAPALASPEAKRRRKGHAKEAPQARGQAVDPLIWCMHGGPGTGKSHVLKLIRELFTQVLGWEMGLDFQMAAHQAVMADQIGGGTMHHACGISPFGKQQTDAKEPQRQADVAKRVLGWRWLIIDEISMVSPQLLAEVDMKLRDVVRKVGSMKAQGTGIDRAFGGINIIFAGDFWQLEPPSGGFLGAVPSSAHGSTPPLPPWTTARASSGAARQGACKASRS